jgi:hypothetical protein
LIQAEKADSFESAFCLVAKRASLLGGGTGGRAGLLPVATGIWAQDKKDRDRSCDDAGDDDQQNWAAEGLSFLRRWGGGGGHRYLMQNVETRNF